MGQVAQYQPPVSPTHPARAGEASRLDPLLEMGVSAPQAPTRPLQEKLGA